MQILIAAGSQFCFSRSNRGRNLPAVSQNTPTYRRILSAVQAVIDAPPHSTPSAVRMSTIVRAYYNFRGRRK
jgi:hypothetical protein